MNGSCLIGKTKPAVAKDDIKMTIELRDYQKEPVKQGVERLDSFGIALLWMETRTGKTITSLSICERRGFKHVLFLTKVKALGGVCKDCKSGEFEFECDVMSIDSAHKAKPRYYDCIIVDESHCIGAFPKPSLRAKRIKAVVGSADVILLSATPTPESYSQIYHQLWISKRSPFAAWGSFYSWARAGFVRPKTKRVNGLDVPDYSDADIERIEKHISHLVVRATQAEAGFRQARVIEEFVTVEMPEYITKLINRLMSDRVYEMKDGTVLLCDTAAKLASKCLQVASGTAITQSMVGVEREGRVLCNTKAEKVLEISRGKKICVFYKFTAEANMLKEVLPSWTESPEEFQESQDKVFLSQYQSGREGIRLDTADAIVMFTPDHAFLSYEQTKNRIQDLHRPTPPIMIWLFDDYGIDRKVYQVIKGKKKYTSRHFTKDWGIK